MKFKSFLFFFLAFSFADLCAQTESFHFEYYQIKDGLCYNRLTSLHQDNFGFLWIASENGLSRFDGHHFKNFFPKYGDTTTLSSEVIYKIQFDEHNNIWFETPNGINVYIPEQGKFKSFQSYPRDVPTRQAARFSGRVVLDGKIWFIQNPSTLAFYDPLAKTNHTVPVPENFNTEETILFLFRAPNSLPNNQVLGMGTTRGFYFFNIAEKNWVYFSNKLSANGAIFLDINDQKLYYSSWEKGLFCLNFEKQTIQNWRLQSNRKLPNIIHSFLPLSSEEWWLGTESGLHILNPTTGENHRITLPNETDAPIVVRDIMKDRSNNIWLATENGLLKHDPRLQGFKYQKVISDNAPVYENQIYDIIEIPELGNIYVLSRSGYLYILDKKENQIHTLPLKNTENIEPTNLFCDSQNQWWLLSRHEVYQFDPKSLKITALPAPPRRKERLGLVWVAAEDGKGRIWFGLSRDGIFIYDPKENKNMYLTCEANNFCAINIWDIKMDIDNDKVWVGTDGEGLWEGNLKTLQFQQINQNNCPYLPSDQVFYLEQDHKGLLWLSTPSGLCRYDWRQTTTNSFRCFTIEDGMPVNFLEGLTLDAKGNLWGGSTGKIIRINPETMKVEIFDHRFGIDFTPFPISNISTSPTGEFFAGGKRGFLKWFPQNLIPDTLDPKIVLSEVKVLGKSIVLDSMPEMLEILHLDHKQHSIVFEFTTIDFTLPDFNRFDWKLDGYDENWTMGQQGKNVAYTQIPPGNYVFKVRNSGEEFESTNSLNIRVIIKPAYWQTWSFKLLCALTILAALIGIHRWHIRQIREKEIVKAAFQNRIAEVEMTSLRAQMNPHFVFNCLNSINRFIQMSDPDTASDYLTKFSRLIRLVLDNSREETVTLENEIQAIRLYVELEALRFAGRFKYDFFVDENLDTFGIDIPPLLIQPYVENAIWHGLMHKENDDGRLKVSFKSETALLKIIIEDNGIGREAASELKSKTTTRHKSHGMALTQERLATIKKLYGQELFVEVRDLVNSKGKLNGTEVVLTIPFS